MASPQPLPSQAIDTTQTSIIESQSSPSERPVAQRQPTPISHSGPPEDIDPSERPECSQRPVVTYSRHQLLHLQSSPLVQLPEGMPLLKDWFGDWSEQHTASQAKKDGGESNGTTGNRRFPRRDHEEGDNAARPAFRSTLSQPSQMGNFKHQSLRGDLTRAERDRERDRDRDRDNERDKEGHERLRSLSDMYDRDRMALPLTLPPLIRSQRDSTSHLSASGLVANTSSSGRLGAREGRDRSDRDKDRDRDRESGRRSENRESGRRKGGESGDWRRGGEISRGDKDEHARRDQERDGGDRDRSPEIERSRREHSVSRERWTERTRDRDEARDSRREPKGRDRDRDKDRERDRDYHGSGSRAWRDKADEHPPRLREDEERDPKDKDTEKGRDRAREDDRRSRLKDVEGHSERSGTARDRWSERVRDADRDDRRKSREEGEKETKEERKERDRERRERDRERAREHPDAKRDRELREGWTIAEEREARQQLAPSGSSRRGAGRGGERRQAAGGNLDEEKENRRDRDKEPAWMDDYVPEPGSTKAGIFGGKVEGMEDEIQAWKKTQTNAKSAVSNGLQAVEAPFESLSGGTRDTVETAANAKVPLDSAPNDEQAKATEAFFLGLMRSESSKKLDNTVPSKSSKASVSPNATTDSPHPDTTSAKQSPLPGIPLAVVVPTPQDTVKSESAAIPLPALGISPTSEVVREPSSTLPSALNGGQPTTTRDTLQTAKPTNPRPSPASRSSSSISPSSFSPTPGQLGPSAPIDPPPAKTPNAQPSLPFNPPQQSRVLAFSAHSQQSQVPSEPQLRPSIAQGQPAPARPGVIGLQPSPQPYSSSQPSRVLPSPHTADATSRVPSLTEQATQRIQAAENMHHRSMFSPFDSNQSAFSPTDAPRHSIDSSYTSSRQPPINSPIDSRSAFGPGDAMTSDSRNPRLSPQTMLSNTSQALSYDNPGGPQNPSPNSNSAASTYASGRGSRFAKFWDGKTKEAAAAGFMQAQAAAGIMSQGHSHPPPPPQSASPSASQGQRQTDHVTLNGFLGNTTTGDNIQDMLTMLQTSTQGNRMNSQGTPIGSVSNQGVHRQQHPPHLQALHEQQIPHHQPQPQHHFSNTTSLLENHQFDNRPFVPDGMVPGLRPPRSRESSMPGPISAPLYPDALDDSPFTVQQRVPPQQQAFEQLAGRGSLPQLYNTQGPGANRGGGMFQPPFRAEPSPLGGHNPLIGGQQQQRLPPGLANLGGRPPHDPSGYLGTMGMSSGTLHGPGVGHQQTFNTFGGGGGVGLGFGGAGVGLGVGHGPLGQPRAPPPMQTLLNNAHNQLAASGHPDFTVQHHLGVRGPPPGQLMQGGGGVRGGFGSGGHMQPPHVGMRQQQGPHMLPQMLPPHLQQQQQQQQAVLHGMHAGSTPNDHLLSMLMGGIGPRE